MDKTYQKPVTMCACVRAESGFMDCSVRVNLHTYVEPYNDAEFTDGNKQWTIGFGEPVNDI